MGLASWFCWHRPVPDSPASKPAAHPDSSCQHNKYPAQPSGNVDSLSDLASDPTSATLSYVPSHTAYVDNVYHGAPAPLDEEPRQQHLCNLNILDTAPERRFDEITKLACMMFKVPIALVSLVDKERQWFRSVQGLDTDHTDRKSSFCAWTLLPQHPEVLVVEDATKDARFSANMLVTGPPDIRFYAGCPLVASNKMRLGSLCVIDRQPRAFGPEQGMLLANLAEMVVREIERDQAMAAQRAKTEALHEENDQLLRAIGAFSEGIVLVDASTSDWKIEFTNEAWEGLTGISRDDLGKGFWDFFELGPGQENARAQYEAAVKQQQAFSLRLSLKARGASDPKRPRRLTLEMRCANAENLDAFMPLVAIPTMMTAETQPGQTTEGPIYYFATVQANQVDGAAPRPGRPSLSGPLGSLSHLQHLQHASSNAMSCSRNAFVLSDGAASTFDDVKLGQLLGRGSYGRVYRGLWDGALVAVKVLEYSADEQKKLGMEAQLSSQLHHPNMVQTYKHCSRSAGLGSEDDEAITETWIVMEFCNKGSLSDAVDKGWFRQNGSLFEANFKVLLRSAKEVASACSYLHSLNILHGDLNCNNVLLTSSDKVQHTIGYAAALDERQWVSKVCDFGLSRVLEDGADIRTQTFGTITHMPPEMLLEGRMTKAGDVYAFGVVMWELYMGQRPWCGLSQGQILHQVTAGKQLALSPSCPTDLKKFIQRCMATQPAARPTFPEIIQLLEVLEDDLVGTC
ncbi:hypothetical protein QJQ45_015041 [Haematococcus lacustris]|nr:hypothetical protein QJQ45_015041 [Haematococcus lacustris]